MAVESRTDKSRTDKSRTDKSKSSSQKGAGLVKVLPYVLAGVVLIGYFVWMCSEMSTEAPGGSAVPLSIFGAVLLGVLAGGASLLKSRQDK